MLVWSIIARMPLEPPGLTSRHNADLVCSYGVAAKHGIMERALVQLKGLDVAAPSPAAPDATTRDEGSGPGPCASANDGLFD